MKGPECLYKEWNAMELELDRNQISCFNTVLDTVVPHEETMEMIVPDTCPDILQIVHTCPNVLLKSREVQEGSVLISGCVRCGVLYLPEGEGPLQHMEVNIPFRCTVDAPGVAGSCLVCAEAQAQSADTRALNSRKVLTRVNLILSVRAYAPTQLSFCTGAGEHALSGLQQLRESRDTYVVVSVQEKPFTFSDTLPLPSDQQEVSALLHSRASLHCNESKIIGNKLIFKGRADLQILCRTSQGQVLAASHQLPFSQIMEVTGVGEEAHCSLDVQLTGLSCALESGELSVTMEMLAQVVVRESRTLELLTDLYSTAVPLNVEFAPLSLCRLEEQGVKHQSVREIVETEELTKGVLDAWAAVSGVDINREGDRVVFAAEAAVSMLCEGEDGKVIAVTRTIPVTCPAELPSGALCACRCQLPAAVSATPTTGGLEIRLDVDLSYMAYRTEELSAVSDVQTGEEEETAAGQVPSIVLRVMGRERLWDVAKSYRTTTADILRANELSEGESLNGRLLLIPRSR